MGWESVSLVIKKDRLEWFRDNECQDDWVKHFWWQHSVKLVMKNRKS